MLELIVAYSKNGIIGNDNKLLWRLSDDLKNFKEITKNSTIVMGRKTFESIGKALPFRKNIILSRNKNLKIEKCVILNDINHILELSKKERVIIIGGSEIYNIFLKQSKILHFTEVDCVINGDSSIDLSLINLNDYKITKVIQQEKNQKNEYNWTYKKFIKQ